MVEYREFNDGRNRVGDDGSAWSKRIDSQKWRQLKLEVKNGKPTVIIGTEYGRKRRHLSEIVLELFIGPKPAGKKPIHENGRLTDCRLCNLTWGVRQHKGDYDEEMERDLQGLGDAGIREVLRDYYGHKYSKIEIGDFLELEYRTVDYIIRTNPRPTNMMLI